MTTPTDKSPDPMSGELYELGLQLPMAGAFRLAEIAKVFTSKDEENANLRKSFETRGELIEHDPLPLWMQVVASFDHMRYRAQAAEALALSQAGEIERLRGALDLAEGVVASQVRSERYLAEKAYRAGTFTPDPNSTHKSAAEKALSAILAALSPPIAGGQS